MRFDDLVEKNVERRVEEEMRWGVEDPRGCFRNRSHGSSLHRSHPSRLFPAPLRKAPKKYTRKMRNSIPLFPPPGFAQRMAPQRKGKKTRTETPSVPLGALLPKRAKIIHKDESELELEEAVFGRSRGGKGSVWEPETEAVVLQEEEVEAVETGLERLRDENVSTLHRLPVIVPSFWRIRNPVQSIPATKVTNSNSNSSSSSTLLPPADPNPHHQPSSQPFYPTQIPTQTSPTRLVQQGKQSSKRRIEEKLLGTIRPTRS